LFKLAVELGKTVQQLENELSSTELNEWIAYFEYLSKNNSKKGE